MRMNGWLMRNSDKKWQGILINGQFPGPPIEAVTNDNLIISVFNALDEPFLISWLVPFSIVIISPLFVEAFSIFL